MFKWLFHILIFATNTIGKYQNKEKPLKRQRKLGPLKGKPSFCFLKKYILASGGCPPDPPLIKCISNCLFTCASGFIFVVDLLTLELLIFRLIIAYFGTLRMHQSVPFFQGEHAPGPPSTSVKPHHYRATYALSLVY